MPSSIILPAGVDIDDRDARLLGRTKVLDSGGTVIDPATKGQLPAALAAGGGLKVEGVAGGVAQPVSGTVDTELPAAAALSDTTANPTAPMVGSGAMIWDNGGTQWVRARGDTANGLDVDVTRLPPLAAGTNNIGDVDVLTLPATPAGSNEIGRVRITDGTDLAQVLPPRTAPATTDNALAVTPMPSRMPLYSVQTVGTAPAITVGTKTLLAFWHPSTVAQDVYILAVYLSGIVTTASTAGRSEARFGKITTAPTGGSSLTPKDQSGFGASAIGAAGNIQFAPTGGAAEDIPYKRKALWGPTEPANSKADLEMFKAQDLSTAIVLRGGTNDGVFLHIERNVAHTALVDTIYCHMSWVEL